MKRRLEPVDLMVAVGVFATVLGGYLLFMSINGPLQAATPEGSTTQLTEMQWVQPVLGQAIVDDYLLGLAASYKTTASVKAFNRATMAGHRLQTSPVGFFEQIRARATAIEAEHAARVQFVLGRLIVNFTARGVGNGLFATEARADAYNGRMIQIAEATAKRMDENFQSHRQAMLGQAIMTASQDHAQLADRIQQQIGSSIIEVVRVQEAYRDATAAMQEQLASAAFAAVRTEARDELLAELAAADPKSQLQPLPLVEARSWPEIPIGFLFVTSVALIGIFCAGLVMPSARPEPVAMEEMRPEVPGEVYRKTA